MPVTKSAEKRMRQTVKRTARNRHAKSVVKTAIRRFEESLQDGDREVAQNNLRQAVRQIDQAVAKGILHKNNAARKKSRLTRLFNEKAG
ncbi:MAG: 30S ribosomal protein S20 [Firmicutes bacterium]|nr:30S ribosomal protein S20 [Bacillota bacterium]